MKFPLSIFCYIFFTIYILQSARSNLKLLPKYYLIIHIQREPGIQKPILSVKHEGIKAKSCLPIYLVHIYGPGDISYFELKWESMGVNCHPDNFLGT